MTTSATAPTQSANPSFEQLYQQGRERLQSEDFDEASQAFTAALELEPRHAGALCGLALCLRNLGDSEQAQHILNRALFLHPSDLNLLDEQGQLYLDQSAYPAALKIFDQMLGIDPGSELAVRKKAEALRQSGNFEEAKEVIDEAAVRFSANTDVLKERAWLYFDQKLWDQAAEAFMQACQDNEASFVQLAKSIRVKRTEFLEAAHRRLPANVDILVSLGLSYSRRRQYEPALAAFDKALTRNPGSERAALERIKALRSLKKFEEAKAAIKDAMAKFPGNRVLLREHAMLHVDQEHWDQAIEVFVDAKAEAALANFLDDDSPEKLISAAEARLPNNITILNRVGQLYFEQKQYERAIAVFDKVLKLEPDNEEALKQRTTGRAWSLYSQKQYDAAVAAFLEAKNEDALRDEISSLQDQKRFKDGEQLIAAALKQMPHDSEILNRRGWLLIDQRRFQQAEEAFGQALRSAPQGSEADENDSDGTSDVVLDALVGRCESMRLQRRFADAEAAIDQALNRGPNNPRLLNERGLVYYDQALYDRAVEAFDTTIKLEPDSPDVDAVQWKMMSLRAKPDFAEAERVGEQALELLGGSAPVYCELGNVFNDQGQLDKADEFYRKALEEDPDYLDASLARADVFSLLNRSNERLDILQKLEASRPDDLQVRESIAFFYLDQNAFDKAEEEFRAILDRDPDSIYGINGMGALNFEEHEYRAAEEFFRKALAREERAEFHNNLALALARQIRPMPKLARPASWLAWLEKSPHTGIAEPGANTKQLDEAETQCHEALRLNPNYAEAYNCLGVISFKRGNFLKAEDFFLKSVKMNAKSAQFYVDLGALYSQMGRYDQAENSLNKARELNRSDVQARLELGNVYLQTGRPKDAVRMFREAMAANPNAAEGPRALALALMQAEDFMEAGRVLRQAIRTLDQSKTWHLRLTLCQLLTRLANKSDDKQLYEEALKEASRAIMLKPDDPAPYFHSGIVYYKLEQYGRARSKFRECLKIDPDHFEGEQNLRRVEALVVQDRRRTRGGLYLGVILGVLCLVLLTGMWVLYFRNEHKVTSTMVSTLSPILLGLVFVAFLLPWLSRLKLPGFEADLVQREEKISTGPTGSVEFGSSSVSSGPQ